MYILHTYHLNWKVWATTGKNQKTALLDYNLQQTDSSKQIWYEWTFMIVLKLVNIKNWIQSHMNEHLCFQYINLVELGRFLHPCK